MATDGLVVVDKPPGLTSHDVVARMRRLAGTRRVGHGGTLDPMATGVLIIGVGRATRLLQLVIGAGKAYRATLRLGQATTTDDAMGEPAGGADPVAAGVTEAALRLAAARFVGEIDQVPSAVSAIKVGGVRAYARVRQGEQVALAPRRVVISALEVTAFTRRPALGVIDVDIDVSCSSGTYVRAIARDLGTRLGVGAHLTALRRTAVGAFAIDEAMTLDELAQLDDPVTLPLATAATRFFARRDADETQARALANGGSLPPLGWPGRYAVFAPDGRVVAVVSERDGLARPEIVLAPAWVGEER